MRPGKTEGEAVRNPIRGIFPGLCAWRTRSAQRAKPTTLVFLLLPIASCLMPVFIESPVRTRQHIRRNGHTDLLGGFEIYYKLELHRLLHRQVRGLSAFEELIDITGRAAVHV